MPSTRFGSQYSHPSFGDLSRFLREGVADEESRQLRDSLGALSQLIDDAVTARREGAAPETVLASVQVLMRALREHQWLVTGAGSAWHALYEFGAYQNALKELRSATDAWHGALLRRSAREGRYFDQFETQSWRTLGEALLMFDMYEHSCQPPSDWASAEGTRQLSLVARARLWLRKWRR